MPSTDVRTVVLTRDVSGNIAWGARLRSLGFHVYSFPTIETVPLKLDDAQKDVIRHLLDFDWLVFTSAKSVQYFNDALSQLGVKWSPDKPSVAAIGPQTTRFIEELGIPVAFKPSHANSIALGNELTPINERHILLPQTDIASNDLSTLLTRRGGKVSSLLTYTTRLIEDTDETFSRKLTTSSVDFLIFASSSAVQGFALRVADTALLKSAKSIPTIAIGSSTASILEESGYSHIYTSNTPTLNGIIEVLQQLAS